MIWKIAQKEFLLNVMTLRFAIAVVVTAMATISPAVALRGEAWLRIGLIGLCSLAYVSLFFLMGLAVSTHAERSNTSLIILFFTWVCLVVVVPDGSAYVAKRLNPVTSSQVIKAKREALDEAFWNELREYVGRDPRPRDVWDWDLVIGRWYTGDLPYASYIYFAPKETMEWYQRGMVFALNRQIDYADKRWHVYRNHVLEQKAQARLAMQLARVSPTWLYGRVAEILAGTDPGINNRFLDQARRYRQELLGYVQDQNGFSSSAYFSQMTWDTF